MKRNGHVPTRSYPTRSLLSDFFDTDRFFTPFLGGNDELPSVNVIDNEKNYEIEVAAPGMKKEDFRIDFENGILNISAETKSEKEEEEKNYTRREFSYRSFSRSFSLPENANEEDITAKYDNGVLRLTLAKKTPESPKRKEITVG